MPCFQDARIHKSTGVEYRYKADYTETDGQVEWTAAISLQGRNRLYRMAGTVDCNTDETPAWSAVATTVRSKIDEISF